MVYNKPSIICGEIRTIHVKSEREESIRYYKLFWFGGDMCIVSCHFDGDLKRRLNPSNPDFFDEFELILRRNFEYLTSIGHMPQLK